MATRIVILGTGGNCVDILDTLHDINRMNKETVYQCAGFLDDDRNKWGSKICDVPVLGPLDAAPDQHGCQFVNGIGSPTNFWMKQSIIARTSLSSERFETLIHPSACVSSFARLGRGTVVFPNVTITSNVRVGDHVIVLPNSVISHDDQIGDYTCITGGVCISGGVSIGHSCYLGTGSVIKGNLRIGSYCLIGMGSVVLQNIDDNTVVVGNPAKPLRKTILDQSSPINDQAT